MSTGSALLVECEVLPGLEEFLEQELARRFQGRVSGMREGGSSARRFAFRGAVGDLLGLRTAHAAYLVLGFAGRRPTALLGHQNLQALVAGVALARKLHPPDAFRSFRLGAAGRDSSTFSRLAAELEWASGLPHDPEGGDLLLRFRPWASGGWEALVRLSPRPLATRAWRVRDLPGALNATIAAAMVEMTRPVPGDRFANLACGSGTLLVERLLRGPAREAVGCDLDSTALEATRANVDAAGLAGAVRLVEADATASGLPPGAFDAICADLPYGNLVGSHGDNARLYPALLEEAGRLARPGAAFVAITHELRLFEACLPPQRGVWRLERRLQVLQGGTHPRIYLLRRQRGAYPVVSLAASRTSTGTEGPIVEER